MPTVSVVIATYNMGIHVSQAVASVLAQEPNDLEVVVVDDGSTDSTLEVLSAYASDPRVTVIAQANLGQPKAKNAGIRACKGRFIAFCDADDYWLPGKLAKQMPLFEKDPRVGVVYSRAAVPQSDGSLKHSTERQFFRGDVLQQLFVRNIVPFGTAVVRKECLDQVGYFDESIPMGIDWDLWLRVAAHWHFDYSPEPTYAYRIWSGQMSHNWRGRYDCALKIMDRFLESHPGLVSPGVVAVAYADTYTNLATLHLQHSGVSACAKYLARALAHRVTYWPAWRLLMGIPYHALRSLRT